MEKLSKPKLWEFVRRDLRDLDYLVRWSKELAEANAGLEQICADGESFLTVAKRAINLFTMIVGTPGKGVKSVAMFSYISHHIAALRNKNRGLASARTAVDLAKRIERAVKIAADSRSKFYMGTGMYLLETYKELSAKY